MRRRKLQRGSAAVELNLAAMLDMAFQLLTFFILTFQPPPNEGEVALRMPPPREPGAPPAERIGSADPVSPCSGLEILNVRVLADSAGGIGALAIEDAPVAGDALEGRLRQLLGHPDSALRQVVIQAGSRLRYDALMSIVDKCARQKLADGSPLKKLSFVELPDGA